MHLAQRRCLQGLIFANTGIIYQHRSRCEQEPSEKRYSYIIVGSGTAGLTTAYFLSKWLIDAKLPGNVLLIERGVDFFSSEKGPSPKIKRWYDNWSSFSEVHDSSHENGEPYPVTPSDHKGLGGCSTHDTRITFQLRDTQKKSISLEMGWDVDRLESYYQVALNLIPLSPAISPEHPVPFYTELIRQLSFDSISDDEHKTEVNANTIAVPSLAMYDNKDELRWTPAYLMHESVRPNNLFIITDSIADKVLFSDKDNVLQAIGVDIIAEGKEMTRSVVRLEDNGALLLTCGSISTAAILQRSGIGPSTVLSSLDIPIIYDNPEVGHGVDHEEIAIIYEWLDKWNNLDGSIPFPTMGWPVVAFGQSKSQLYQAHIGAGYAEPYTSLPSFVVTPAVTSPDISLNAGYRVQITSKDPSKACLLIQGDHTKDIQALADGVYHLSALVEPLIEQGLVGPKIYPPFDLSCENHQKLLDWIKMNHWTVYHWASTAQCGKHGRVADEFFRVRCGPNTIIDNLLVGSAACLPELSEANPHLTVTAFAIALAEEMYRRSCKTLGMPFQMPSEIIQARQDWSMNSNKLKIRRTGRSLRMYK